MTKKEIKEYLNRVDKLLDILKGVDNDWNMERYTKLWWEIPNK